MQSVVIALLISHSDNDDLELTVLIDPRTHPYPGVLVTPA